MVTPIKLYSLLDFCFNVYWFIMGIDRCALSGTSHRSVSKWVIEAGVAERLPKCVRGGGGRGGQQKRALLE